MSKCLGTTYLQKVASTQRWLRFTGAISLIQIWLLVVGVILIIKGESGFAPLWVILGTLAVFGFLYTSLSVSVAQMKQSISDAEYIALAKIVKGATNKIFNNDATSDIVRAELRYGKVNVYALRELLLPFFGIETIDHWNIELSLVKASLREDLANALKSQVLN